MVICLLKNHEGRIPQNWKGGINDRYYQRLGKRYLEKRCNKCGSLKYLLIHHKNFIHLDNRLKNLETVCKSCHEKIHNKARNFKNNNFWKKEEIDFLKRHYKIKSDREIGLNINRTTSSVELKRESLGLNKYRTKEIHVHRIYKKLSHVT
jgi:hypothetical protein